MAAGHNFQSLTNDLSSKYNQVKNSKFLNFEKLHYEEERMNSFALWPVNFPVDPIRLAKAGFYYSGVDDDVICFSCHGHIKNWNYGDVVLKKHTELYPECDFINCRSNNIPLLKFSSKPIEDSSIQNSNLCNKAVCNDINDCTKMKTESKRLKSFTEKWPLKCIAISDFIQAGFFYTGIGDRVQCAYCKGIISNWENGDVPSKEHFKHFPWCDYVSENIVKIKNRPSWFDAASEDICGNMKRNSSSCSSRHTEETIPQSDLKTLSTSDRLIDRNQQHRSLEELGVHLHKGPVHPDQATVAARLRSFVSWPSNAPVRKEDLAVAGFFYIGINDHTKCFHCNGGLCNWEEDDDPWIEHARWFYNCDFLHLNKGSDFIKSCITKYPSSTFKEYDLQNPQFTTMGSLIKKVDEAMNSNLVKYVLEMELFPAYIVRAAIVLQMKERGCSFSNIDDLCIAVSYLKEEMNKDALTVTPVQSAHSSISENCAIQDVSQMEDTGSSTSNPLQCSEIGKLLNIDNTESSTNVNTEEDFSKDHCLCKICMDKEVGVVFLPCGHLLSCTVCAPALKYCPMCRSTIQATVRAYLN